MRSTSGHIWDVWVTGAFYGDGGRPHGRVTVETGWTLQTSAGAVGTRDARKLPVRWFMNPDRTELEVPNIKSIHISRSVDQDAGTCEIVLYNTEMQPPQVDELGQPGAFTWSRGATGNRWGHTPNTWAGVLVPNALIRCYQGYGGVSKTIPAAVADGNIVQSGTWLVDEVRLSTDGTLTLRCRDMMKLAVEQPAYPPLVPSSYYPLDYRRYWDNWRMTPYVSYGNVDAGVRLITGIESDHDSDGYWLIGDDGGVFTFGHPQFYGSMGGLWSHRGIGMARTVDGGGYWMAASDGTTYAFGDAPFIGNATSIHPFVAIECSNKSSGTGFGYYLCDNVGAIFAYGNATYYGGTPDTSGLQVAGMAVTPNGDGYWLVDTGGHIFAYGAAQYLGNAPNNTGSATTAIGAHPVGMGYYTVTRRGDVYAFGTAIYRGGANGIALSDPISDIAVAPNGHGYWLCGEDGGVFTYSGAPPTDNIDFWGSLPGGFGFNDPTDGNCLDYVQPVKDLLLWAGWWAYANIDTDGEPAVYGDIETTGIFPVDPIPPQTFSGKPVIDGITAMKEVVGYNVWVDDEGGFNFTSPNWWGPGNFLMTGEHTTFIPTIDETQTLITYGVSFSDKPVGSEIVVASNEPTDNIDGTVTTRVTPSNVEVLKGLIKPFELLNDQYINVTEQQIMAELIAIQTWFQQRLGQAQCAANPHIQINDQVRFMERQTEEMFIHYVRTIDSTMDFETGEYTMTLSTNWLGSADSWVVQMP